MRDSKLNSLAFAALSLVLCTAAPAAFGFTRNIANPAQNCDHANGEHTDFRNLIHKAHIMGNPDGTLDDRRVTMSRAHTVGIQLSREEMQQMTACHGEMRCTLDRGRGQRPQVFFQSAALALSNSVIRTAAHMFFDDKGRSVVDKMNCEYRPYQGQPQRLEIANAAALSRINPLSNQLNDRIAIRLKTPIHSCSPYPAITSPLREGENLIAVTHLQQRLSVRSGADGSEPVVTPGLVGAVYPQIDGSPTGLHLNLSAAKGASGGRLLVRRNGRLYDAGMIIATPGPEHDGQPFSLENDMLTMGLAMDAGMVEMVRNPGADPSITAATRPNGTPATSEEPVGTRVERSRRSTPRPSSQNETEFTDI